MASTLACEENAVQYCPSQRPEWFCLPIEDDAVVQRVNEYSFYDLAASVHPLTEYSVPQRYTTCWYTLFRARTAVRTILEIRPLTVCSRAAQELIEAIDRVVPADFDEAIGKRRSAAGEGSDAQNDEIPEYQIYYIAEGAKKFETVLAAEAATLDTYFISQKGSYRTPDLIERAEIIFPESIRSELSDKTRKDIREAGRCLALDIPTGAAFHILRALESVMAGYYTEILGKPMPTRMRNWGIYIRKLRESGRADAKVLNFLDHIRENYRNPIQHPDVFLSADEVEILLGVAASSIRQMILSIQKFREESAVASPEPLEPLESELLEPEPSEPPPLD